MNVFTDAAIATRLATGPGVAELSLLQVLEAAERGQLVDLARLRPYQRPSVVSVLAILLHLGRRYSGTPFTAADFLNLLQIEKLASAGRLTAPLDEPALLQPILDPQPPADQWRPKTIGEIDGVFASLGHETKPRATEGTPDQWLYALICGNHRIQVAQNPAGVRWGLACVLTSDGRTIGSEIRLLADAYDAAHRDASKTSLTHHFVWLRPRDLNGPALPSGGLPQPFLEAPRPLRLVATDGKLLAVQVATHRRPIDATDTLGLLGDPQVATVVGKGPYRWTKRRLGYRVWHAMLFGVPDATPPVEPAETARRMPGGTSHVRICGIAYDQGISEGYHERLFRVPEQRRGLSLKDRLEVTEGGLSKMALEAIARGSYRVLRPALRRLDDPALGDQSVERFEEAAGYKTITWVWEAFAGVLTGDDSTLFPLLVREARAVFEAATETALSSGCNPLLAAQAQLVFEGRLRREFPLAPSGDRPMAYDEIPALCRQIAAVLEALAQEIGPPEGETAKRLRAMDQTTPGIVFWSLLAAPAVPATWAEDSGLQPALLVLLIGMARIRHLTRHHGQPVDGFGRALAKVGYAELRMSSLLSARGSALVEGLSHARQMLESSGVDVLDWRLAAQLLISDADNDAEGLAWSRRRLALDYARQLRAEAARAAA